MTDKIIVLSACAGADEAERMARHLVEKRLAACVNIVPGARSIYRWKGAIEDATEWLLIIKSRRELLDRLSAEVAGMHSYETPEVLAIPVADGAAGYLNWMERELSHEH